MKRVVREDAQSLQTLEKIKGGGICMLGWYLLNKQIMQDFTSESTAVASKIR